MDNLNKDSLSLSDRNFIRQENNRMLQNERVQKINDELFNKHLSNYNRAPVFQKSVDLKPPKIEYIDYYSIISDLDDHELLVVKNIKNLCKNSLDFTFSRKNLFKGSNITVMTADEILSRLENKYKFLVKEDDGYADTDMYSVKSYALLIDKYNLVIKNRREKKVSNFFNNIVWKILIPIVIAVIIYWTMQELFPPVPSASWF